jgi:hypothetical protein
MFFFVPFFSYQSFDKFFKTISKLNRICTRIRKKLLQNSEILSEKKTLVDCDTIFVVDLKKVHFGTCSLLVNPRSKSG